MRDFSKVSPRVWRSKKFRSLPDVWAKQAYLYLLTSPHGNSAGCYDLDPLYAASDIGMTEIAFREAIESLSIAGLIEFDKAEQTVLIVNWEAFNEPTNPKHALGLLIQLNQASSSTLKNAAFHRFLAIFRAKGYDRDSNLKRAIETLLIDYPEPIPTKTETKMETERETRPRGDLDLDARESSEPPRFAVAALTGNGSAAIGNKVLEMPPLPDQLNRLLQTNLMRKGQAA